MTNAIEAILARVWSAAIEGDEVLRDALDNFPAAICVTDIDGFVTYFNPACIDFTGRRPQVGADRWSVTWRLYTNISGFLPHDECPMAVAISTQRAIRGLTAVAERPDGTRVNFRSYPTPIFEKNARSAGAVNLLEDVTDELRADDLKLRARRCRRLAAGVSNERAADSLNRMAEEFETKEDELRNPPI
jgi:PAS domain-containing protein